MNDEEIDPREAKEHKKQYLSCIIFICTFKTNLVCKYPFLSSKEEVAI